ncbi:hypothetical protein [Cetobacterium sp.]
MDIANGLKEDPFVKFTQNLRVLMNLSAYVCTLIDICPFLLIAKEYID